MSGFHTTPHRSSLPILHAHVIAIVVHVLVRYAVLASRHPVTTWPAGREAGQPSWPKWPKVGHNGHTNMINF